LHTPKYFSRLFPRVCRKTIYIVGCKPLYSASQIQPCGLIVIYLSVSANMKLLLFLVVWITLASCVSTTIYLISFIFISPPLETYGSRATRPENLKAISVSAFNQSPRGYSRYFSQLQIGLCT